MSRDRVARGAADARGRLIHNAVLTGIGDSTAVGADHMVMMAAYGFIARPPVSELHPSDKALPLEVFDGSEDRRVVARTRLLPHSIEQFVKRPHMPGTMEEQFCNPVANGAGSGHVRNLPSRPAVRKHVAQVT